MNDARLQVLLDRYFDEGLTDAECVELEQMLLATPRARDEFWSQARFHALIREWGQAEWGRHVALSNSEVLARPPDLLALCRRCPAWVWSLAAAAGVVLAALIWLRLASTTTTVAHLERFEGKVLLIAKGVERAMKPQQAIHAGEGVRVEEESLAVIVGPDATRLEIQANSAVRWMAPGGNANSAIKDPAKRVSLDQGSLMAEVAHQPAGQPLVFVTPHAEVIVRGTRLSLANLSESTYVRTDEGLVEVRNKADAPGVLVPAGFAVTVVPGLAVPAPQRLAGPTRDLSALPSPVAVAPDVELLRDVEFGRGGKRPLTLNLFRPRLPPAQAMPAVVLLHSGAWWWGDKDRPMQGLIPLVLRGYLVVSVEYRLSGEAVFPAQIEDCKCAIRFLRAHAGQLQLAPDRLGVWGMAAGGQLAALLGLTAEVKELEGTGGWGDVSSRVQAVADFYGPTDLTDLGAWQGKEYARSISRLLGEESLLDRPELARRASPMSYVRGDAPPFLIVHGDHDRAIPVAQSQALAAALQKAGANVTLKIIPGAGNMFNSTEITEMAYRFFDQHLK